MPFPNKLGEQYLMVKMNKNMFGIKGLYWYFYDFLELWYYSSFSTLFSGVVGILGYIIVGLVFLQPPFKNVSMIYHWTIAVFEFVFSLYCIAVFCEMHVESFCNSYQPAPINFFSLDVYPCEWMDFFACFLNCSTNAITVAISAERFLAISFPSTFRKLRLSTRSVQFVIVSMCIAASLILQATEYCVYQQELEAFALASKELELNVSTNNLSTIDYLLEDVNLTELLVIRVLELLDQLKLLNGCLVLLITFAVAVSLIKRRASVAAVGSSMKKHKQLFMLQLALSVPLVLNLSMYVVTVTFHVYNDCLGTNCTDEMNVNTFNKGFAVHKTTCMLNELAHCYNLLAYALFSSVFREALLCLVNSAKTRMKHYVQCCTRS